MLDMVPSIAAGGSARSSLDLNNYGGVGATPPTDSQFNLLVRTLTGKTYFVDADPEWNIEELKSAIEKVDGCPAGDQRLVLAGQNMQTEDGHALQEYGIKDGDKVVLMKNNN
jgi:Ubiquitin family